MWLKPMKRTKRKTILKNQQNKLDFETSPKEWSFTNKYKNKTLRQDIVSLKQTKKFTIFIDKNSLVGNYFLRKEIIF